MRGRLAALLAVLAVSPLTSGCTSQMYARNAPGHVDPRVRPRTAADREPQDPGMQSIVLAYGGQVAMGTHVTPSDSGLVGAGGGEVSLFYGREPTTQNVQGGFFTPETLFGVSAGVTALSSNAARLATLPGQPGPQVYGEAALRVEHAVGLGAGWAVDVDGGRSGPQATFNLGPLYVRGTRVLATETFVTVGLVVKFQHAFVWSR